MADEHVRSNSVRRYSLEFLTFQMGCGLPGNFCRFIADVERMTERRDLCRCVDVRWHRIALTHRSRVAGEDLTLGRPVFGNVVLRHWSKLFQLSL